MTLRAEPRALDVIWHDLECGAYTADLGLWRALAARHDDPVLDVGAGTGRVALDLARAGHEVTALDRDPNLIEELARRSGSLPVATVVADAREFDLGQRFALIILPMQTMQLLGGRGGRRRFLTRAVRHLRPGGMVAVAISETLEPFAAEDGFELPAPDTAELDGFVYRSQPTAVREDDRGFVLERRRETIGPDGERRTAGDAIRLDPLTASELEAEAAAAGLAPSGRELVPPTGDYVGSVVVKLGG